MMRMQIAAFQASRAEKLAKFNVLEIHACELLNEKWQLEHEFSYG